MSLKRYLAAAGRLKTRMMNASLNTKRWSVAVAVFVLLVIIMSLEISSFGSIVEAGKASPRTITAPRTVQYIDKARTKEEQDAAAAAVPTVVNYDGSVKGKVENNIQEFFQVVNEVNALQITTREKIDRIRARSSKSVYERVVEQLLAMTPEQRQLTLTATLTAAGNVMDERITSSTLNDAYNRARSLVTDVTADQAIQAASNDLLLAFLESNSTVNAQETERRRMAAREGVKPIITTKLQGEVIIRKGEMVTQDQVDLLKTLGFTRPAFNPMNLLWFGLFTLALMGAAGLFLARARRPYFDSPSLLALLGGTAVVFAVVTKVLAIASNTFAAFWGFFVPSAAVTLIIAVLFDIGIAIMMAIVCGLITGAVSGGNFSLAGFALLGALFPALVVSRRSTRHEQRRAGLYTCFWLAFVAFCITALTPLRQDLLINAGVGLLNGAICSVVAMGSLPFLETTFGIPTNTWLLELASPEQGLLKELSLKAPGTYSHSVMVANLAEAAAREIGSDPLLARVASYYHDVGKMKRPQFFVENQPADRNPHDSLSPNLSALIITSHVKDGVDMLERNHMPPDLIDIVRQHHGNSLVRYFYEQAVEADGKDNVEESRFRYHLEKPRRKTTGILLLADAVEATARTLNRPTRAAIEQMVERIVNEKLEDGQLDRCELTFNDVRTIKKVFSKVLISTHHPRIDYPASPKALEGKGHRAGKNNQRGTVELKADPAAQKAAGASAEEARAGTRPGAERGFDGGAGDKGAQPEIPR